MNSSELIANLGPLAPLAGVWESDQGIDTSRVHSQETVTKFREKLVFEPLGPVNNGPQVLYQSLHKYWHYALIN